MKLSKSMAKMWNIDVTDLSQLEKYEKQGYDISEFKAAALAKAQSQQAAREVRAGNVDASEVKLENPVDLDKLAPYISAPRDAGSAFVQDCVGFALLGKDKKIKAAVQAPLVYGMIVQANDYLYKPNTSPLPAVVVIAPDAAHATDIQWLNRVANGIKQLKNSADVPADQWKLIKSLRVGGGYFCCKIGASLAGDVDAWCATTDVSAKLLPQTYLPSLGLVPFLLTKEPEENRTISVQQIPAKYYS